MQNTDKAKQALGHQVSGTVTADLNYIQPDATIAPEVIYSGGAAPQAYNEAYKFMPAEITDARNAAETFTIHAQGFELVTAPTQNTNFNDDDVIKGLYYDEVADIVRKTTGAKAVAVSYTQLTLPTTPYV